MNIKQCFQIFELPYDATNEDIKQKYKDLARVWHPDRFGGDVRLQKQAEDKMKNINAAYSILGKYLANPAEFNEEFYSEPESDNCDATGPQKQSKHTDSSPGFFSKLWTKIDTTISSLAEEAKREREENKRKLRGQVKAFVVEEKTVYDPVNNIIWARNANIFGGALPWKRSLSDVFNKKESTNSFLTKLNKESYAGISNWRLPTHNEMSAMLDYPKAYDYVDNEKYLSDFFNEIGFAHVLPTLYWCKDLRFFSDDEGVLYCLGTGERHDYGSKIIYDPQRPIYGDVIGRNRKLPYFIWPVASPYIADPTPERYICEEPREIQD